MMKNSRSLLPFIFRFFMSPKGFSAINRLRSATLKRTPWRGRNVSGSCSRQAFALFRSQRRNSSASPGVTSACGLSSPRKGDQLVSRPVCSSFTVFGFTSVREGNGRVQERPPAFQALASALPSWTWAGGFPPWAAGYTQAGGGKAIVQPMLGWSRGSSSSPSKGPRRLGRAALSIFPAVGQVLDVAFDFLC